MAVFYNLAIWVYGAAIRLASLWNKKARDWVKGRKNWQGQLEMDAPPCGFDLWMHCSSLGEFGQGRPVLESFRNLYPDKKILLTFFSPSGYAIRKNYPGADLVTYLPLDTKKNARDFLRLANPVLSVFVKYDFWPNMMKEILAEKRRAYLIAAKFHSGDQFHSWYGAWTQKFLQAFEIIFLQDDQKVSFYPDDRQIISGDTRMDRVIRIQEEQKTSSVLQSWKKGPVFIWGSIWPEDLLILKEGIHGPLKDWQHIIAPHDISPSMISRIVENVRGSSDLFSSGKIESKVVILDTIGDLASCYSLGELAYIGGGFGKGIHNIQEPLAAGLPVFFGPKHQKFIEGSESLERECGFSVSSEKEFFDNLKPLLEKENRDKASNTAKEYIRSKAGATEIILDHIKAQIHNP
ncbi:MAG: 3-deoxy-D-manno-octulosonic acid transferase [Saprospiraceae bacterium]|nr:3-deoxy-D-manno-octulosonic acid transferase [Saprospiraceae bacterium]